MAITITITKVQEGIQAVQNGKTFILNSAAVMGYQRRDNPNIIVLGYGPSERDSVIEFLWNECSIASTDAGNLLFLLKKDYLNMTPDPVVPPAATAKTPIARFCLAGGTENAVGNYAAATDFVFAVSTLGPTAKFTLRSICAFLIDAGSLDMSSYGNGITLTNGVKMYVKKSGVELDLMAGKPVLFNQHWSKHGWGTTLANYGTGNESLQAVVNIADLLGAEIDLFAAAGDMVIVRLQDNYTGLVEHSFKIGGYLTA